MNIRLSSDNLISRKLYFLLISYKVSN